jgi:hypothetical protein
MSLRAAKKADVPIKDLVNYLRLHPHLDRSRQYWLYTKLEGRLAAPWTCLVVVLIAIPFGAAGGRRNVFVGVASSIMICFVISSAPAWAGARDQRPSAGLAGRLVPQFGLWPRRVMDDSPHQMSDELADLKARYDRLNVLYQVGNVIHTTLEPQEALQLDSESGRGFNARSQRLHRADQPDKRPAGNPCRGKVCRPTRPGSSCVSARASPAGWRAQAKPARVGDVRSDPRYVLLRPEVRSELAVPLEVAGEVRGVLNVDADRPEAFSAEDQELLAALAAQAARVIHNTWLYEQLRLKARLFESLASVSRTINSTLNLDDALNVITREGLRADAGQGLLADAAGREPRVARIAGQLRRGRGLRQPAALER